MTPEELAAAADPTTLGNYLAELPEQPHHHGPLTTIRQDDFRGHRIVVTTTYEVTVDGEPLHAPLIVTDDGQVHCHALPTYEFRSATDTIRALIENFPDDFPGGDHDGCDHEECDHDGAGHHGAGHHGGGHPGGGHPGGAQPGGHHPGGEHHDHDPSGGGHSHSGPQPHHDDHDDHEGDT
ncbi:hypothetical protein ABZZ79_30295 [Streptomyces sp. NPDC006458]|uniref:hypothetical protein n=1 Tax=Streptomyces sp. NPDC006458 TaxID=3154302 RepID=UPI0033A37C16